MGGSGGGERSMKGRIRGPQKGSSQPCPKSDLILQGSCKHSLVQADPAPPEGREVYEYHLAQAESPLKRDEVRRISFRPLGRAQKSRRHLPVLENTVIGARDGGFCRLCVLENNHHFKRLPN